jgi:hypothetical protein
VYLLLRIERRKRRYDSPPSLVVLARKKGAPI